MATIRTETGDVPVMTTFRALALLAVLSVLPACGTLSALGDAATPSDVYVLDPPDDLPVRQGRPQARDIIIEEPTADGAIATDRIMIQPRALQAQYLPDVRWSDPAPIMLQTLMLRALDSTNAFQYVGRRPLGPGGDFAIVSEIVDFQAELGPEGETAEVTVRMIVRIVRERGAQVVATRQFAATGTAASLDDLDLVEAFDDATARVVSEFTVWTLGTLGAI
jgi:cholesterol transport system auxiliary component